MDFSIFRNDDRCLLGDRFYPHKPQELVKKKPAILNYINPEIRVEAEFRYKWRQTIIRNYNARCAKCGYQNHGNHAHHIYNISQHPRIRYKASNGILFCKKCHDTFHKRYGYQNNNLEQVINYLTGV